ncbi:MAG: ATPase [Clostridia bacterium]|jgi:vacuolar-type H+-ATPase subunit H
MEVNELLARLEEIVNEGMAVPFSDKVLVDREKVLEVVDSIKGILPEEIKQANWIKEERNRILIEAQKEADLMLKETEEHIKRMVEESEVTRRAYIQGEEIIENAKKNAREIRIGTKEYADNLLAELEKKLCEYIELIKKNREEVKNLRS